VGCAASRISAGIVYMRKAAELKIVVAAGTCGDRMIAYII
jgi:hypothetical protein